MRLLAPTRVVALEILLPAGFEATSVRVEGRVVPFVRREVGRDRYVRLEGQTFAGEVVMALGRADARGAPAARAR